MLSATHRLTDPASFRRTTRGGRRASARTIVVHLATPSGSGEAPRVGLVVGKSVGNSVVRHRVQRRLRHQLRERLDRLPLGATLVVRALPAAAEATSSTLGRDLDGCLTKAGLP